MSETTTPLSLNEIDFYFTRAAVGAGTPFGIGEDFAEASKSLAYLGFDPAQAAVPALRGLGRGQSSASLSLRTAEDAIHVGSSGAPILSALYAGPAIADRLSIEAGSGMQRHFRLNDTDQPLLIVGAIASAGIDAARIALSWPLRNGRRTVVELKDGIATASGLHRRDIASLEPAPVDIVLNGPTPQMPEADAVVLKLSEGRSRTVRLGVDVDEAARSTLLAYFDKCLVPTTDRSRDAGAGAGLTDND